MGEDKRREESSKRDEGSKETFDPKRGGDSGDESLPLPEKDEKKVGLLNARLEKIASDLERSQMAEYVDLLNRPISLIWRNLLAGTSRGIGIAIGFTFFAATILYVLQLLGQLNLPIIGNYIADIVRIVKIQLEGKTY